MCIVVLGVTLLPGCSGQDRQLQQHEEKFESLQATTQAIAEGWLAGGLSGTYTRTALEQTHILVEQERSTLASAPETLRDPAGARLSQRSERLSRLIAVMIRDALAADGTSMRQHVAEIPITLPEQR